MMSAVRSDLLDEEQAPLVGTRRRFGGEQLHSTTSYRDDPVRVSERNIILAIRTTQSIRGDNPTTVYYSIVQYSISIIIQELTIRFGV